MKIYPFEPIETNTSILKEYSFDSSFLEVDRFNQKLNSLINTFMFLNTNNTQTELI